ncbi:MAG: hypothetical protein RLZZ301_61 [Bacteroidota bacterium]|jgi:hypothetical protein
MSSGKSISWTKVLIGAAIGLFLIGLLYKIAGGPRQDQVTKEQAQADSLRQVLRQTQDSLQQAEAKNRKVNVSPAETPAQKEERLRNELWKSEIAKPLDFLSLDYDYSYHWFWSEHEYKGQIHNSASIATFMNMEVRVTFLSATRTALGSKVFTVYKYCAPNSSVDFKFVTKAPADYKYHQVELIRAVGYQPNEEAEFNEQ